MLPICLGEATKVAGDILAGRKCYRFSVALGERTATGDAEGAVIEALPVPPLSAAHVEAVLQRFLGAQRAGAADVFRPQARRTAAVPAGTGGRERASAQPRQIEIFEPDARRAHAHAAGSGGPVLQGHVRAGAGRGDRRALGTCGHVSSLRRRYVEPFAGHTLHTLESLQALAQRGAPPPLLPIDAALMHLPAFRLSDADTRRLLQGQRVAGGAGAAGTRAPLRTGWRISRSR